MFSNCITIENSGSVGSSFFHKYEFVASDHITKLKRDGLDMYAYLFMIPLINRLSEKYSFNREINDERIKREKLILPICENGQIDFNFMSKYMKKIETKILTKAIKSFECGNVNKTKTGGVRWKAFYIDEIAEILSGRDIYDAERETGNTPYITATATNNGIGYFVNNTNETLEKECLSVNRNGSVGNCFYHPYSALYGNDTRKLRPIHKGKYVSMFLATVITKQKGKYSYGLKMGTERLKKQRIMLPCTLNGSPDYEYMESCMRNIENRLIATYFGGMRK